VGKDIDVVTTVKENGPKPEGGYTWRGERGGGIPGGMTLDFDPQDGKTLVSSELEYEMPGGVFGRMAGHLGVKQAMERSLRNTLENLKNLSEEDWFMGRDEKKEEYRPCDS
jgi:uncharacterized membrane protein